MLTKEDGFEFNVWYESYDVPFVEMCLRSHLKPSWMTIQHSLTGKYKDSILKPVNRYVEFLYQPPELVSIEGNTIRLRQYNHAEFWLLDGAKRDKKKGEENKPDELYFKNIDRPHIRQYYQSRLPHVLPEDCFPGIFKFYVPWLIDANITVRIEQPKDVWTPFHVYEASADYAEIPKDAFMCDAPMVPFHFKNVGEHMVIEKKYGKIPLNTPLFDIIIEANDIIKSRIEEFYEKKQS